MNFPVLQVPLVWMLLLFLAHPLLLRAEFVEVAPQVKIYYESSGQGDPLLFVPGWMMTAGVWKEQVATFPLSSVAVTTTVVAPTANAAPELFE